MGNAFISRSRLVQAPYFVFWWCSSYREYSSPLFLLLGTSNFFIILVSETYFIRWAQIGYSAVGAIIFSLYIIYDTQIMLGGNHKYSISPEEYIFAALNLYIDVINLFQYILMIIGASRSD